MSLELTVGGWWAQAFIQTLIDNIGSYTLQQFGLKSGLKNDIRKLANSLLKVRAVLSSADKKQIEDGSLYELLKQLKDTAYDADDLLDEFEYEHLKQKIAEADGGDNQASGLLPLAYKIYTDIIEVPDAVTRIREIQERLDEITADIKDVLQLLGDHGRGNFKHNSENRVRPESSSLVTEKVVFGRDEDKKKVIELLLKPAAESESESEFANYNPISIRAIVGMGGVGKTTLAQLVYNDSEVQAYFQLRIWVCVSDPFDVKRLLKEILEHVGGNSDFTNLNRLQTSLQEKLVTKRFLLVLDDVWNEEDKGEWESLCAPLRFGARGSQILLTTRSRKVAKMTATKDPIVLEGLSDDYYWLCFKRFAFGTLNSENYPVLEAIGRKIASRLKGSPLAAKTLGSLLNTNLDVKHWTSIMESDLWKIPQGDNDILPALKLSYRYLPAYLKQCFSYCALFPKDYKIDKVDLVYMWIAQGFIIPQENMLLENIGGGYFDDLVCRSFFQYADYVGSDRRYFVMHDLVHDLAQFISGDECFLIKDDTSKAKIPELVRHLTVCNNQKLKIDFYKYKKLQTLVFLRGVHCHSNIVSTLDDAFKECTSIRVLHVGSFVVELPNSISNLKHLRYLHMPPGSSEIMLPETLCNLCNLQLLIARCYQFPKGTKKLINLRRLSLGDSQGNSQICKISEIGRLTSLQDLKFFEVKKEFGHTIKELRDLNELHEELHISNLQMVDNKEEASQAMLSSKKYLNKLHLQWDSGKKKKWASDRHDSTETAVHDADILESLTPHPNLKVLRITSYAGVTYPSWLDNQMLPCLEEIYFTNCDSLEQLFSLRHWSSLKIVCFEKLNAIRKVGPDFYGTANGFPLLERLSFKYMLAWEEWSVADADCQVFLHLRELDISYCPNLRRMPHFPSLTELYLDYVGLEALPGGHDDGSTVSSNSSSSSCASLSKVDIINCSNLTSLEEWLLPNRLPAIEKIGIYHCEELTSLPTGKFKEFACLKELFIINCTKLRTSSQPDEELSQLQLPSFLQKLTLVKCGDLYPRLIVSIPPNINEGQEEGLSSLTSLWIDMTLSLQSLRVLGILLTSLKTLYVTYSLQLTLFNNGEEEEWLQQLTSLEELGIINCAELQSLPRDLSTISTLKWLDISHCPKLKSLPDNGLPSSLRHLEINECHPDLKERCQRNTGADWPKIAHIPIRLID